MVPSYLHSYNTPYNIIYIYIYIYERERERERERLNCDGFFYKFDNSPVDGVYRLLVAKSWNWFVWVRARVRASVCVWFCGQSPKQTSRSINGNFHSDFEEKNANWKMATRFAVLSPLNISLSLSLTMSQQVVWTFCWLIRHVACVVCYNLIYW